MIPEPTEKQRFEKRRWHVYGGTLILLVLLTVGEVAFYYDQGLAPFFYIASCMTIGGGLSPWPSARPVAAVAELWSAAYAQTCCCPLFLALRHDCSRRK